MNKELEKNITFLKDMVKEYKTFGDLHNPEFEDTEKIYRVLETALNYIKNSIPKQLIEDKIEELKEERKEKWDYYMGYKVQSREQQDIDKKIEILEELLEGK